MKRALCVVLSWAVSACATDANDPNLEMTGLDLCLSRGNGLSEVTEIDNNVLVAHGEVGAMALAPTGQMALASSDGAIKLWSIRGEAEGTAAPEVGYDAAFGEDNPPVGALAYAPDGGWIASGRESGEIAAWSATSGEKLDGVFFSEAPVESIDVSPDGDRVAAAHRGADVRVWRRGERGETEAEALPTFLWGIAAVRYLPGGALVTAGHDYGTPALEVRSPDDPATIDWSWGDIERQGWLRAIAASPDGSRMAAAGDGILLIFDLGAAADAEPIVSELEGSLRTVAFSPGGEHLIATDDAGAIRVFSGRDGGPVAGRAGGDHVGVYAQPGWEQVATADRSGLIRILGCGP